MAGRGSITLSGFLFIQGGLLSNLFGARTPLIQLLQHKTSGDKRV
jgi:hypothetical protein